MAECLSKTIAAHAEWIRSTALNDKKSGLHFQQNAMPGGSINFPHLFAQPDLVHAAHLVQQDACAFVLKNHFFKPVANLNQFNRPGILGYGAVVIKQAVSESP